MQGNGQIDSWTDTGVMETIEVKEKILKYGKNDTLEGKLIGFNISMVLSRESIRFSIFAEGGIKQDQ